MRGCWVEGCVGCGASDEGADLGEGFAAEEDSCEVAGEGRWVMLEAESPPGAGSSVAVPAAIGRSFGSWVCVWCVVERGLGLWSAASG